MMTRVTVAAYPNQPFDGVVLKVEPQAIVEQNVTMFSVLIKLQNRGRSAEARDERGRADQDREPRLGLGRADGRAARGHRRDVVREDAEHGRSGAARADLADKKVDGASVAAAPGAGGKNVLNLGGREITLPDGVDAKQVMALMEKRRGGQDLSQEERDTDAQGVPTGRRLRRRQWCRRRSGRRCCRRRRARRRGRGRRRQLPARWFPGGGFVIVQGGPGAAAPTRGGTTNYQFGGEYWVVALRNDQPVPVAVRTGLTDLEYSEIVSGLEPGDRVLLLPSTSLYEQQERLQQFISQRFGASTPFQQNQQQNIPRQFR